MLHVMCVVSTVGGVRIGHRWIVSWRVHVVMTCAVIVKGFLKVGIVIVSGLGVGFPPKRFVPSMVFVDVSG